MKFDLNRITDPAIVRALEDLEIWTSAFEERFGFNPLVTGKIEAVPPTPAEFSVSVNAGHYMILITNPPDATSEIIHEIRYSALIPFALSPSVGILGPSPQTLMNLYRPASSLFFQLRSRYVTSGFNQPRLFSTTPL